MWSSASTPEFKRCASRQREKTDLGRKTGQTDRGINQQWKKKSEDAGCCYEEELRRRWGVKVSREQWGGYRLERKNTCHRQKESNGLMLRNELAAEIQAGSATVKVANETPWALAGWSMARGGRVFLERLGAPPEGVPALEQGRPAHCCQYPG